MKPSILIVDDEANLCWSLKEHLTDEGFKVSTASNAEDGLELLRQEKPGILLLDIILPGMTGLECLELIQSEGLAVKVIVMTAHGTMSTAIEAIRKGAYEYITKPFDLDKLGILLQRASENIRLSEEVVALRSKSAGKMDLRELMVGSTVAMQEVYKKIGAVAGSGSTVLIRGESGTGKELTARAIHYNSARSEHPFVAINCGSLPEQLLESELFGHEKGAFTGAVNSRQGRLESAQGGTVFLDEIGDVSPALQVTLLRFLEERTFERVGGNELIEMDVRVIAATHQSLEDLVAAGSFREDLFYRLNVVDIQLPSLKERKEDIPLLVAHFLTHSEYPDTEVSAPAMKILMNYGWPGNVRELRNAIEHGTVLSRSAVILPEHLPVYLLAPSRHDSQQDRVISDMVKRLLDDPALADVESRYESIMQVWEEPLIRLVVQTFQGNQVKASEFLQIHRTTFRNKLKKYGLS